MPELIVAGRPTGRRPARRRARAAPYGAGVGSQGVEHASTSVREHRVRGRRRRRPDHAQPAGEAQRDLPTMLQELHDALWEADDDTSVHCVVLGRRGPGVLRRLRPDAAAAGRRRRPTWPARRPVVRRRRLAARAAQRLRMALFDMHKPVIAQVHGYCLAGGTDLATLCDMIICADDARFGFPPGRDLGVLPNQMWLYHVGPQWAKRLLLTGDTVTGVEAAQIGLALKSVPADLLGGRGRRPRRPPGARRPRAAGGQQAGHQPRPRADGRPHDAAPGGRDRRPRPPRRVGRAGSGAPQRSTGCARRCASRDAPFGDGRARVNGPELRDEHGALVDPATP